ncbi:PAS-domain containing protein [Mesobacterium pallidum]|uniref:PAS-domain containing protein n=1 Tax=Mesobacterium pallidum TaxID=2872037 RepID=UPI001EE34C67|nr:PAS-domain containing protein [Mesobacterium pallidum]
MSGLSTLLLVLGSSAVTAALALTLMRRFVGAEAGPAGAEASRGLLTFVLSGRKVLDCSPAAYDLIATSDLLPDIPARADIATWDSVRAVLLPRFAGIADIDPDMPPLDRVVLRAADPLDSGLLIVDPGRKWMRLTVEEPDAMVADRHRLVLTETQLKSRDKMLQMAPYPIWQSDAEGRILQANPAYITLTQIAGTGMEGGRPARIFDLALGTAPDKQQNRVRMADAEGGLHWFDICSTPMGDTWMHHAVDINAVVKAELQQRNFVQTLTKTFAHLSTGLAIFDRNRQLVLFNPALVDLTALPIDFLSARPDLSSFFDRMRDKQMMPEPKNYAEWRTKLTRMIADAAAGQHLETWTLPSGQTYRVTGRPHPDGAIAFLFEDISADMSLTRRFRSEIDLGHAVLDTLEEAICVFSRHGVLVYWNKAYTMLWQTDTHDTLAEVDILSSSRHWQKLSAPSPVWGELRDFARNTGVRAGWTAEVTLATGERLDCRVVPLAGGKTLIGFRPESAALAAQLTERPTLRA